MKLKVTFSIDRKIRMDKGYMPLAIRFLIKEVLTRPILHYTIVTAYRRIYANSRAK
jgi:hypothetical protein